MSESPATSSTRTVAPLAIGAPIQNFEGLSNQDNFDIFGFRVNPPDTVGDVGPTQYVQSVNLLFRVFDKATGNPLYPLLIEAFRQLIQASMLEGLEASCGFTHSMILMPAAEDGVLVTIADSKLAKANQKDAAAKEAGCAVAEPLGAYPAIGKLALSKYTTALGITPQQPSGAPVH